MTESIVRARLGLIGPVVPGLGGQRVKQSARVSRAQSRW